MGGGRGGEKESCQKAEASLLSGINQSLGRALASLFWSLLPAHLFCSVILG